MHKSLFGKTMENVRNGMELNLTTQQRGGNKKLSIFSRLNLKNIIVCVGVHMIEMSKHDIVYDKPIYVRTPSLDLRNFTMMKFHYDIIQKSFENTYNLLHPATDSLAYSIQHNDIYGWIRQNREHFDLSDSIRPNMKDGINK